MKFIALNPYITKACKFLFQETKKKKKKKKEKKKPPKSKRKKKKKERKDSVIEKKKYLEKINEIKSYFFERKINLVKVSRADQDTRRRHTP